MSNIKQAHSFGVICLREIMSDIDTGEQDILHYDLMNVWWAVIYRHYIIATALGVFVVMEYMRSQLNFLCQYPRPPAKVFIQRCGNMKRGHFNDISGSSCKCSVCANFKDSELKSCPLQFWSRTISHMRERGSFLLLIFSYNVVNFYCYNL